MNETQAFMCHLFQSEGNYAFVNTMGRRQMKNSCCFENDTASEK